jgi:hypothetical protein
VLCVRNVKEYQVIYFHLKNQRTGTYAYRVALPRRFSSRLSSLQWWQRVEIILFCENKSVVCMYKLFNFVIRFRDGYLWHTAPSTLDDAVVTRRCNSAVQPGGATRRCNSAVQPGGATRRCNPAVQLGGATRQLSGVTPTNQRWT